MVVETLRQMEFYLKTNNYCDITFILEEFDKKKNVKYVIQLR
jgi:hypothetical protein